MRFVPAGSHLILSFFFVSTTFYTARVFLRFPASLLFDFLFIHIVGASEWGIEGKKGGDATWMWCLFLCLFKCITLCVSIHVHLVRSFDVVTWVLR